MEICITPSVIIVIIISSCFILFLVWIIIMVFVLKNIPNQKVKVLGVFFSKLPIKRFLSFFSNNNINKNEK